jgi:hypothetical protein
MALEDIAPGVFGQFPDMSGSLSPEQVQALQNNAAKQALLASAVTMLGMSGNQRVPVSTGQALGAALGAGSGAYQGSFDNTLKQMIAGQQMQDYRTKAEARRKYEQAIAGATTRQPIAMPMAQGQGSQLEMLSRPEFGGGMAEAETVGALRANLPTRATVDPSIANQAALDYLRQTDPAKFIELTTPKAEAAPASVKEYQFAVSQGYKGSYTDYQLAQRAAGAAGGVSLTVNTEKSFGGELGTQLAKQDAGKFDAASKAPSMLSNINATRDILNSGNVITGAFADEKLNVARVGQALGVTGKSTDEMVANTQTLFASRAGAVLDSIRASGLGAGQGFSNADRDYLEKAKMGGIKFSPDAMKKQLDIEEKVARATAGAWNERFDQMPDSAKKPLGLTKIELPAAQATGTTTGVKKYDPISRTVK